MNSIIIMALLISVIITIINAYHGFSSVDENRINCLKVLKQQVANIYTSYYT